MAIHKKTYVEKAVKAANLMNDIKGKLKNIIDYSGLHAHVRSVIDNGTARTEVYEYDKIREASKDWS